MSFKIALGGDRPLFGLWQAIASGYTAEICAHAGYDWLLFDGEHSPNSAQTLLSQLQAVSHFPLEPIARVPSGDPVSIKQYLDLGFTTLLVPMVDNAEQATAIVSACRYPPHGMRGVASATARATGFGTDKSYLKQAADRITVIAQIESRTALDNIAAIASVDGIDALFIGPADLAASLGHLGNPMHPDVQSAIATAKNMIDASGKPAGIFALSPDDARNRVTQGFRFISIGSDIAVLLNGAKALISAVSLADRSND
jgi:4-hydroxy-2-oxoheptanedioate aldolase